MSSNRSSRESTIIRTVAEDTEAYATDGFSHSWRKRWIQNLRRKGGIQEQLDGQTKLREARVQLKFEHPFKPESS